MLSRRTSALRPCQRAQKIHHPSRQHIPAINEDITPRRKTRRITRQIQINPLDLPDIPLPPQHRHPMRLILTPRARPHLCIKEPGAHNINPRKLPPLPRQTLAQVRHCGLGRVVYRLVDGDIDDMRGYTRRDDQVALALGLEHGASILRAEEHPVEIHAHLRPVLVESLLEDRFADRHTRVRDEDVNLTEITHDFSYGLFNLRWIRDFNLIRARGDAVLLRQGGAGLDGGWVGVVPERQVAAGFGEGLGDGGADAGTGAGDNGETGAEGELGEDVGGDVLGRRERRAGLGAVGDGHGHRSGGVGGVGGVGGGWLKWLYDWSWSTLFSLVESVTPGLRRGSFEEALT